jgi:hypothetical protein
MGVRTRGLDIKAGATKLKADRAARLEALLNFDQGATMKMCDPRQLELFSDGAGAVAARRSSKPPPLTEADLQARLDGARMRLHEIVILRMKTWLPEETLKGLKWAEAFRREQVRVHHRVLACGSRPAAPPQSGVTCQVAAELSPKPQRLGLGGG